MRNKRKECNKYFEPCQKKGELSIDICFYDETEWRSTSSRRYFEETIQAKEIKEFCLVQKHEITAMFLIDTLNPRSVVENCFFKKIVEQINPSCELPGRKKEGMLNDLASHISVQIKDDLKSVTVIAMDCWTSKFYSRSNVAISAAFSR